MSEIPLRNPVKESQSGHLVVQDCKGLDLLFDDTPTLRQLLAKHIFYGNRELTGKVYAKTWVLARDSPDGKKHLVRAHHFILPPVVGMVVDHINGNGLDNRRCNLRYVTPSVNSTNRKGLQCNNTTGVSGLTYCNTPRKQSWTINWYENKKRHVKSFGVSKWGYDRAKELAIVCLKHQHSRLPAFIQAGERDTQ